MNEENPRASDWAGVRGDKWSENLDGMEGTLKPVDEPLILALELDRPLRIAEVGSGGGGTTIEILRRAPSGSVVHGFDISPRLVEAARRRAASKDAIVFEVVDMSTATPQKPYDRLVSRFGIMFFEDPAAAFANLVRWLEPGGRFAFAAWGPLSENPWMTTVRDVVTRFVDMPKAEPDAPGPFRYGDSAMLRTLLERAGFSQVDGREWRGELPIGGGLSPEVAAAFVLGGFGSFGELLANAGDDVKREAESAMVAKLSEHQKDGRVRMDACVRIFTGTRA